MEAIQNAIIRSYFYYLNNIFGRIHLRLFHGAVMSADLMPKRSFSDLVQALSTLDDDLAQPDFDPAALIGEIRDKVDGLKFILDKMEATGGFLRDLADPLLRKAKAIENNHARLCAYVTETMKSQSLEKVPGHSWAIRLKTNPPAVTPTIAAGPIQYNKWPDFCLMERSYRWDKKAILVAHRDGKIKDTDLPVTISRSRECEFIVNVPAELEAKKKKAKAT
jgi:hypothetical protein